MDITLAKRLLPILQRMNQEMRDTTRFASLSVAERIEKSGALIDTMNAQGIFKRAFLLSPQRQDARDMYFHFIVSLETLTNVSESPQSIELLARLFDTQGLVVSKAAQDHLSKNAFATYAKAAKKCATSQAVHAYFTMEVFVSDDNDVKRSAGIFYQETWDPTTTRGEDFCRYMKRTLDIDLPVEAFDALLTPEGREWLETEFFKLPGDKQQLQHDALLHFARNLRTCAFCARRTFNLSKCSACKAVYYCDAECQKKHWPEHKKDCKPCE